MKGKELRTKTGGLDIKLGNETYNIKLNMNTFCKLEDIYDNAQQAFDELEKFKFTAIRALIWAGINAELDKDILTIMQVGEMVDFSEMESLATTLMDKMVESMPELEEDGAEEEIKN